jgi:hypothetical protein
MKILTAIGLTVLLLATALPAGAKPEDNKPKGLPYKMLDDASQFVAGVDQSKFIVLISIHSKRTGVHPQDIHLTIQSAAKGAIPLHLATNGIVTDFPHDEALRQENPSITSDQPAGSLQLMVACRLPLPDSLTFPYRQLSDDLAEVNKASARATQMMKSDFPKEMPAFKQTVNGMIFFFHPTRASKATLTINTAKGLRTYRASDRDEIKLTLDPKVLAENPTVTLSEMPVSVMPDL